MGPKGLGDARNSEDEEGLPRYSDLKVHISFCLELNSKVTCQVSKRKMEKLSRALDPQGGKYLSTSWFWVHGQLTVHKAAVDGGNCYKRTSCQCLGRSQNRGSAQRSEQASRHFAVSMPPHDGSKKFCALVTLDTRRVLDYRDPVSTLWKKMWAWVNPKLEDQGSRVSGYVYFYKNLVIPYLALHPVQCFRHFSLNYIFTECLFCTKHC